MTRDAAVCDYWDPSACEGSPHCPPRCPRFVDANGVPWVVRPFDPTDWRPLFDMYVDFGDCQRAQGLPPVKESRVEEWLNGLLDEGCNFVASDGERVVGHAVYTPTDAAEPELALFVHRDYQNRGLGTELCRHVVAAAAAADRDAVVLAVEAHNRAARRVYEKVGFRRLDAGAEAATRHASELGMRHPLSWADVAAVQRPPALRP